PRKPPRQTDHHPGTSTTASPARPHPAGLITRPGHRHSQHRRHRHPERRRTQALLDAFTAYYNTRRPHRSLPRHATPAVIHAARPKAPPGSRQTDTHDRVRTHRVGVTGTVTLRHAGRLHRIGIGRTHAGTHILLLVHDLNIRIINAATGELLRHLT